MKRESSESEIDALSTGFLPSNVGVEAEYGGVEPLVSSNEGILVDLPDFLVIIPGCEVFLEALCVLYHPVLDAALDLSSFFILF